MKLKIITCSGANEHTEIYPLVSLIRSFRNAEVGVQVSGKKGGFATARYWWLMALHSHLRSCNISIPIALHLNLDWVESFCQGKDVPELTSFLFMQLNNGEPFIKRVQLNFKIGREKEPDMGKLYHLIKEFPHQRFIFSYNESNRAFIQKFHDKYADGFRFDLLCDNSFGEGVLPGNRPVPLFNKGLLGYAGGLSADNVTEELDKIAKILPSSRDFFIDAEGKLKGNNGHLCLKECQRFLENASKWDEF